MIQVAAAVIIENGQLFISSRPADKPPAGWEFPGGKLEPGESAADAAKRELMEELGMIIEPGEELYTLTHKHLCITFIRCAIAPDSPLPDAKENQSFKWVELTAQAPDGLLENDLEFWDFLVRNKINRP